MFFSISLSTIEFLDVVKTISEVLLSALAIIISVVAVVKTSKDNNMILEETSRAYVSIYTEALIANRSHFYIVFRNFGKTNAIMQNIEIDEKTKEMTKIGNKDFFSYIAKCTIAPGQSITHVVTTGDKEFDFEHVSEFIITYLSGAKVYTDKFEFSLGMNTRMPSISISSKDVGKQFLELYQDEIRKKL